MNLDASHFIVAAGTGLISLLGIVLTSRSDVKWLRQVQAEMQARITRIENHLFK